MREPDSLIDQALDEMYDEEVRAGRAPLWTAEGCAAGSADEDSVIWETDGDEEVN